MAKNIKLFKMFNTFFRQESIGGLLIIFFTLIALLWANLGSYYKEFWHSSIGFQFGDLFFARSFHFWINDVLLVIFFFVVTLEIKREVLVGELSSLKQSLLPLIAAIGGIIFPALIFLVININSPQFVGGWAIPTVTDTAFSLGILALLGKRIPIGLKLFLTALAIADDIIIIPVIAFFYAGDVVVSKVVIALILLLLLAILNFNKVRIMLPYAILGILLLITFVDSGFHTTLAGVLLALFIPTKVKVNTKYLYEAGNKLMEKFSYEEKPLDQTITRKSHIKSAKAMKVLFESAIPPLYRFERMLHPWVTFVILPLFALANAGIDFSKLNFSSLLTSKLSLGILLGIIFGKQIGVTLFSWLAVKLRLCILPKETSFFQIYAVSILSAIGFTMSLYISNLSFSNTEFLPVAKASILLSTIISAVLGYLLLFINSEIRKEKLKAYKTELIEKVKLQNK